MKNEETNADERHHRWEKEKYTFEIPKSAIGCVRVCLCVFDMTFTLFSDAL